MSNDYLVERYEYEGHIIEIHRDDCPSHPDEGNDDAFFVSLHNDFHITRRHWDSERDFQDFLLPRHRGETAWTEDEEEEGVPEPEVMPEEGPNDPIWMKVYTENTSLPFEQLLLAAGETCSFEDPQARATARDDYYRRMDIWEAWRTFRSAHAEWACFAVDVRNYGGGHMSVSLGDIYTEPVKDRWGNERDQKAFLLVRKDAGWVNPDLRKIAESVLQEWTHYIDGEVYGYIITDKEGNDVESCWGFIGDIDYCKAEAEACLAPRQVANG